jgi:hypothetical protein
MAAIYDEEYRPKLAYRALQADLASTDARPRIPQRPRH